MIEEVKAAVGSNEQILYEGKPDKKCFIFESIFNPMFPVALIWALFDFFFIGAAIASDSSGGFISVVFIFLIFHLMPVWMYLGGVLFTTVRYKNIYYIVTDRAVYISGGVFTHTINSKPFAELSHVNLHRGIFDQIFHVGDIILTSNHFTNGTYSTYVMGRQVSGNSLMVIGSISNYMEVFTLIKKLQTDIYTDVMYPNDKRPLENHGYQTEYKN